MVRAIIGVGILLISTLPSRAMNPNELLNLVPDDYTFCLVGHETASAAKSAKESRFIKAILQSPLLNEVIQSTDFQQLMVAKNHLVRDVGVSEEKLTQLLFGGTFALTYRKSIDGKKDSEAGMFLLRTDRVKELDDLVQRINQLQIKNGDLSSVDSVEHRPNYFKRVKADRNAGYDFYFVGDGLFIFTSNEAFLRETLKAKTEAVKNSVASRHHQALGLQRSPLSVLINPRSLDSDVANAVQNSKPGERVVLEVFGKTWKAIDQLGVYVHRDPQLTLGFVIGADYSKVPQPVQTLFSGFNRKAILWNQLPANAMVSTVIPFDLSSIDQLVKSALPEGSYRKLKEEVVTAFQPFGEELDWPSLLKLIGPDLAIWVSPWGDDSYRPSVALAVPLNPDDTTKAGKTVSDGLDFLLRLLCLSDRNYRLSTEKKDGYSLRKLSHPDFPSRVEPCYTIKNGALLIATHPRMFDQYVPKQPPEKLTALRPIIRISGETTSQYLLKSAPAIAAKMSSDQKQIEMFTQILKAISPIVAEMDRLELNTQTEPNLFRVQLQLFERSNSKP